MSNEHDENISYEDRIESMLYNVSITVQANKRIRKNLPKSSAQSRTNCMKGFKLAVLMK